MYVNYIETILVYKYIVYQTCFLKEMVLLNHLLSQHLYEMNNENLLLLKSTVQYVHVQPFCQYFH